MLSSMRSPTPSTPVPEHAETITSRAAEDGNNQRWEGFVRECALERSFSGEHSPFCAQSLALAWTLQRAVMRAPPCVGADQPSLLHIYISLPLPAYPTL